MHRHTTKHDDDLQLGCSPILSAEDSAHGGPLREGLTVLNERLHHLANTVGDLAGRQKFSEDTMSDMRRRLAVIEERLSHAATKSWVLGCAVALLIAMLSGTLGGVWWMFQQYIGPLLRASTG